MCPVRTLPLLLLLGCGSATAEPPLAATPARAEADAIRVHGAPRAPAAGAAEDLPPGRIRYDLAAHLARAELRQGRALLIDHGSPGGAKYTLGGWLTAIADGQVLEESSVAVTTATRARFQIPWDGEGDAALTLKARLFGNGPLRLYLNGAELAPVNLPADRSGTVRVVLPEARIRRGENTLLLRVRRTVRAAGLARVGVAVDWMRIEPASAPVDGPPPPDPTALSHPSGLRLPAGFRLGWTFEVPERGRLRALVSSDGADGALLLRAHRDGRPPVALGRVAASGGGERMDVDLGALAGQVVRLDLEAEGADLRLLRPLIVTPDEQGETELRRPRNVVVYLVDTLRADKLRPYRPTSRVRTPGLDRFVESAATFTAAHAQENWTKPSVATLLSSLMPWQHTAVRGESVLPDSVLLLPEILREQGFYTGSFIANGYVSDRFGFRQGWDTYRNYIREGRRTPAQYVAADVLSWLDERPADRPFFLYIHTIDPHVPYRPPRELVSLYQPAPYRGPVNFRRDATLLENVKMGRIRLGAADRQQLEALYDGEITYHDIHFNAIIEGLARRGLADDTMIVITSDHGEEFWDHGSVGHGHNVYEELLHVPMFIRLPGVTRGAVRVDEPMGLVDVLPTILDALGRPIPEDVAGRSVLPELLGRDLSAPAFAVSGFMEGWRTVVVGRTKLIHRTAERVMLHDLVEDPGEQNDVADQRPIAVRYARGLLGLALVDSGTTARVAERGRRPRPRHGSEDATIDAEMEAQLRALGYVGSSRR